MAAGLAIAAALAVGIVQARGARPPEPRPGTARSATARLDRQLRFVAELEKLKTIRRHIVVVDQSRHENSAEHSWHLATMAVVLAEHAPPGTDLPRSTRMALLHDVVEIEAGDTFAFDLEARKTKPARERAAARRLYGLLPRDQRGEFLALWRDFEAGKSPEARFVRALDRIQPVFLHRLTGAGAWKLRGITRSQLLDHLQVVERDTPSLWPIVNEAVRKAVLAGELQDR